MPKRDNKIYCLNHPEQSLIRNLTTSAFINFDNTNSENTLNLNSGVPVNIYICPICGYVESYSISVEKNLNRADEAFEFENDVYIELKNKLGEVIRNYPIKMRNFTRTIDFLYNGDEAIYIIEAKLRAGSRLTDLLVKLGDDALSLKKSMPLEKRSVKALLILAEDHDYMGQRNFELNNHVRILRYDRVLKRIIGLEEAISYKN